MLPDPVCLLAVVAVLFSLGYFAMASIPFLFVRLDIPEVWRLFRGLFDVYFWVIGLAGLVAGAAFATSGHAVFTTAMFLLSLTAITVRTTVLREIDARQTASQSGSATALRQLRRIHWYAMLLNLAILASVVCSLPFII